MSGKLERLSEEVLGLDSKFNWLIQGTESMLNVASDQEITDIGRLHVSVGLEEQINHTVHCFWEGDSITIVTEQEITEGDEETMQLFEKSVHFKY